MAKLSVIIPSRNEPLLKQTVDDILKNATGDIEIIIVLDGPTEYPLPTENPKVKYITKENPEGLRAAVNDAAKLSNGEFIMKTDAHVAFSRGFDEILQKDIEDNWIVIPRRYDLNINTWEPVADTLVDYYYLGFPFDRRYYVMADMVWPTRTRERMNTPIDDLMTYGGTVWFTSLKHFNSLGGMNSVGYGTFIAESQELGIKTWLTGGRVIINKNAWYAHYGEGHSSRPYKRGLWDSLYGCIYSAHYWTENRLPNRIHDFEWLIEKFSPLPSPFDSARREKYPWPLNWKEYFEDMSHLKNNQLESLKQTKIENIESLADCFSSLDFKTGAVIGDGTESYLKTLNSRIRHLKLYCVNKWTNFKTLSELQKGLSEFNTTFINIDASEELNIFIGESLDFIFIDNSTSNHFLQNNLNQYIHKVKKGGIVAAHDNNKTSLIDKINEITREKSILLMKTENKEEPIFYFINS